jgi:hypothetical protein
VTATFTEPAPVEIAGEPDDYGTPPMIDTPPAADTKPRRPTTRAGRAAARKARQASEGDTKPKAATKTAPRKASLEKRLATALSSVGAMTCGLSALSGSQPLKADGLVIIGNSANMAEAINRVADEDPRVKAALERMLSAGAWSGVVAAVAPVVLAIAANHGAIPPALAALFAAAPQESPSADPWQPDGQPFGHGPETPPWGSGPAPGAGA